MSVYPVLFVSIGAELLVPMERAYFYIGISVQNSDMVSIILVLKVVVFYQDLNLHLLVHFLYNSLAALQNQI